MATARRMKSVRLIAIILAASGGLGPGFADDIALSLVNPKGRIDIPAGTITRVEARATIEFRNTETGKTFGNEDPHVEICYSEDIRQRVCQLTKQIVEQPLAIVIDCRVVTEPIVREPLCGSPCLNVSAADMAEAHALAERIRRGSNRACAPSS
jgi:preprotein translocase subunit SecD